MNIDDFVLVKDRVFSREFCEELINLFETRDDLVHIGEMAGGVNMDIKNTTDLNLFDHPDLLEKYGNPIFEKFNELTNEYLDGSYRSKISLQEPKFLLLIVNIPPVNYKNIKKVRDIITHTTLRLTIPTIVVVCLSIFSI